MPRLGEPHDGRRHEPQAADRLESRLDLARAAVDQEEVRELSQRLAPREAAGEHLLHAGVVVPALRLAYREVPVGRGVRDAGRQDRHRRGGLVARGVREVVGLDAGGGPREREALREGHEPRGGVLGAGRVLGEREGGVLRGARHEAEERPALRDPHLHAGPAERREDLLDPLAVVGLLLDEDLGRDDLAAGVELREEGREHVAARKARPLRVCARRDEVPVAEEVDRDDRDAVPARDADDVAVGEVGGDGVLAGDRRLEGLEPVALESRALVLERLGGRLHPRVQARGEAVVAAAQDRERALDVLGVGLGRDLADAGRAAAADLVVEAGPLALQELAVAARAQRVERAEEGEGAPHRLRGREGPEVRRAVLRDPPDEAQARERVRAVHPDDEVGLVVLQPQVVGRLVLLDPRVLEDQGLRGGLRGDDLHVDGAPDEEPHERPGVAPRDVGPHAGP